MLTLAYYSNSASFKCEGLATNRKAFIIPTAWKGRPRSAAPTTQTYLNLKLAL